MLGAGVKIVMQSSRLVGFAVWSFDSRWVVVLYRHQGGKCRTFLANTDQQEGS